MSDRRGLIHSKRARAYAVVPLLCFFGFTALQLGMYPERSFDLRVEGLKARAASVVELTAYAIEPALARGDLGEVRRALRHVLVTQDVLFLVIVDDAGRRVLSAGRVPQRRLWPRGRQPGRWDAHLEVSQPVGSTHSLHAGFDLRTAHALTNPIRALSHASALGSFLIGLLVTWWTWSSIGRIQALARQSEQAQAGAEQAMRARGEFLAKMSHELRTPLNGVLGTADLLGKTRLSARQRSMVELVRRSGDVLLELINEVLDFSKIEAGKLELEIQPFDLYGVAEEVVETLAVRAHERGLELVCHVEPGTPRCVVGDGLRVRQILTNLVGNAIKFTERGHVEVRLSPAHELAEPGGVCLQVNDTGIGMSEDTLRSLFTAFSQADSSITRRYGGTGLGLAITQSLAALMGGSVSVDSAPAAGSRFRVSLPLPSAEQPVSTGETLARKRFLLLDLHDASRESVCARLRALGQEPSAPSLQGDDVGEAIRRAAEGCEAVVISNPLGGTDGATVRGWLTEGQVDPELPAILLVPIGEAMPAEALLERFDRMLYRPVRGDAFRQAVSDVLTIGRRRVADSSSSQSLLARGQSLPHELLPRDGARPCVLVADDNETNQQLTVSMLDYLGFEADLAPNGQVALERIRSKPGGYHAVLMDCEMPVMDGHTATRQLRSEGFQDLVVVALTAHAGEAHEQAARASGMNGYLTKPVRLDALRDVLGALVAREVPAQPANDVAQPASEPEVSPWEVLDPRVIESLRKLEGPRNPTLMADLVQQFGQSATAYQGRIAAALEGSDAAELRQAAHALKGCAGNLGAAGLARICGQLERKAARGELEGCPALAERARAELARVEVALAAVVKAGAGRGAARTSA